MYDAIIIGSGIIGSSLAYYLSQYRLKVLVLEKENDVSCGTTKANSAIIHAGYDPEPGTLMARYNVEGARLCRELSKKLDFYYQQCGAMVIAFSEEENRTLRELYERGLANGVEDMELLDGKKTRELEPGLSEKVTGALLANSSAIVLPWDYCLALMETAVKNGVKLKLNSEVRAIKKEEDVFEVRAGGRTYKGKYIFNCAGVQSDKVHELIGKKEFTILPKKGEYFLLDKSEGTRVSRTIFQCPNQEGKGVLVSPTVHGNLIVGPNSIGSDREDVNTSSEGLHFVREQAVKSVPDINFRENIRNFAGVRARSDRGDFVVEESKSVKNFFNIASIMSPGLSAAPAIAVDVVRWLAEREKLVRKKEYVDSREKVIFKRLSGEQKQQLIEKDPAYGRVICRCETVTEGEIVNCLKGVIPVSSIDGVKRRVNSGMGRCQGGFCGEKIASILIRELHIKPEDVLQDTKGTNILMKRGH